MKDLNQIAITTKNVLAGSEIVKIYYELDGVWQFLSKEDSFLTDEDARVILLGEILHLDETLKYVIDSLLLGFEAERNFKGGEWNIKPSE